MIQWVGTGRPALSQCCRVLLAALVFGAAGCAAGEQNSVRDIAEAWAGALRVGDAKAYVAALDGERATYVGRLVSTDSVPYEFAPADEARAVSALFANTRVIAGEAKLVEVSGDEAVIDVKLELYDTYAKGGAWQFRYAIATRCRLRTAIRRGLRRIIGITESAHTGSAARPLATLALAKYLHSDLYQVRSIRSRSGTDRATEVDAIVDRRTHATMVQMRRTIDAVRSPLGSSIVEEHVDQLDASGRKIENVEEVE